MFTLEELQLLDQILRRTPITGTIETLPSALSQIAQILGKIGLEMQSLSDAEQYAASHPSD